MKSISIKVAFCTSCKGYCSSTPVDKKDHDHPEIVDQFFYHGEPWFTFDQKTFEAKSDFQGIEVRILDLLVHRIKDRKYCSCKKAKKTRKDNYVATSAKAEYSYFNPTDFAEIESDLYFQDLYHTYHNFHGINSSRKHSGNSIR
ncbi:hypothetical protein [Chryseobacterium wangxinyae]|uniref:hypothetical protein n=1 Tax=Chryseobacterium sp. CY353 TaxID=2997334 RepID=UPI00226FB8F3|nr:hypothetical protein [Chryseobacterium sp. CY353]MCY0969259.1 hypothetical protein [Chryseobacterium sp. CY353]